MKKNCPKKDIINKFYVFEVIQPIDLFILHVLFSQFRPSDVLQGIYLLSFHIQGV